MKYAKLALLAALVLMWAAAIPAAAADNGADGGGNDSVVKNENQAAGGEMGKKKIPTQPENETWGLFDPGHGFLIGRGPLGEMSISGYGLLRYINQMPASQTYTDHLGNIHNVDARNDFFSHRIMVWLKGWLFSPKFIYTVTIWTVNTTDQDAIFMNFGYQFHQRFNLYGGIVGNGGSRSLLGSHPYWLGHDRVMADEFFRPYFTEGIWAQGELFRGFWYHAVVGNNNSALGIKASELDRDPTFGGSVWWMPTTGEFGPRGAYGDWESHEKLALRFGISGCYSPEQRYNDDPLQPPKNTTLKLADAVNLFAQGALAPDVTVTNADYHIFSVDAGMKYLGVFLQGEFYHRTLNGFVADGVLPLEEIVDQGFYVQAAFFPIPKKLEIYGVTSQIYGDEDAGFDDSSEYILGANYYPYPTRDIRVNLQLMDVNHSPVGSTFGYYTSGQDGQTIALGVSALF